MSSDVTTQAVKNCSIVTCAAEDDDDSENVPIEAVAFLGAVAAFVLLLIIFFLYLNKSLCFKNCGGFPCIDKVPQRENTLDSDEDLTRDEADDALGEERRRKSQANIDGGEDNESYIPNESRKHANRHRGANSVKKGDGSRPIQMTMDDAQDGGKSD